MQETAFVSMPFGRLDDFNNEWTKLFQYGLLPLEKGFPKQYHPVRLLRADRNLASLGLKDNVKNLIERSDIVIGVLTTSIVDGAAKDQRLSNPNVLWELGYAEAIGKPIVVLADDESLRKLPLLAGVPNVCIYNHELVRAAKPKEAPQALAFIAKDVAPYVAKACLDAKFGVSRARQARAITYANRDEIDLPGMIAGAEEQIDILTTNVGYFESGKFKVEHPFRKALDRDVPVRIVTMDPESVIAQYRARQLQRSEDVPGYRRELRDGIVRFYDLFKDKPNFHLHIYDDLPLQITTRVDQNVITSVVTGGDRARKRIQILFKVHDEGVTESFIAHFQSVFENSKDVRGVAWVIKHALDQPFHGHFGEPNGPGAPRVISQPKGRRKNGLERSAHR